MILCEHNKAVDDKLVVNVRMDDDHSDEDVSLVAHKTDSF